VQLLRRDANIHHNLHSRRARNTSTHKLISTSAERTRLSDNNQGDGIQSTTAGCCIPHLTLEKGHHDPSPPPLNVLHLPRAIDSRCVTSQALRSSNHISITSTSTTSSKIPTQSAPSTNEFMKSIMMFHNHLRSLSSATLGKPIATTPS
jgi:hypothetical protein